MRSLTPPHKYTLVRRLFAHSSVRPLHSSPVLVCLTAIAISEYLPFHRLLLPRTNKLFGKSSSPTVSAAPICFISLVRRGESNFQHSLFDSFPFEAKPCSFHYPFQPTFIFIFDLCLDLFWLIHASSRPFTLLRHFPITLLRFLSNETFLS
jgi:hypothetical protein